MALDNGIFRVYPRNDGQLHVKYFFTDASGRVHNGSLVAANTGEARTAVASKKDKLEASLKQREIKRAVKVSESGGSLEGATFEFASTQDIRNALTTKRDDLDEELVDTQAKRDGVDTEIGRT